MSTLTISINIPLERIASMLCAAFEGGSNSWYFITKFVKPKGKITSFLGGDVFRHVDYPLNRAGAVIITVPDEAPRNGHDGDPALYGPHRLDLPAIEKGFAVFVKDHPGHFGNFLAEGDDAETADVFLQCCLFGKVVFA